MEQEVEAEVQAEERQIERELMNEIRALREQVRALDARLDQTQAAQKQETM